MSAADKHLKRMEKMQERQNLKRPVYMETRNKKAVALYCKVCGEKIAGLIPVDNGSSVIKGPDGQRTIETRVEYGPLANYTTIIIECNDGSKHETPICIACLPLLTEDDKDDILAADTEAELQEGVREGRPLSEATLEQRVQRKVKRVR